MSTSKTHCFTSRFDGGESKELKKQRKKQLQQIKRSLSPKELQELNQLIRELGNG